MKGGWCLGFANDSHSLYICNFRKKIPFWILSRAQVVMSYYVDPFSIETHQEGLVLTVVCHRDGSAATNTLWNTIGTVSAPMVTPSNGNIFRITGFMSGESTDHKFRCGLFKMYMGVMYLIDI